MGVDYFVAIDRISIGLLRVFRPERVAQLTNHFLAPHYHIELADDWQWETTGFNTARAKSENRPMYACEPE